MAEHRALRAIQALKQTLIAANTSAGANVELGRVSDITEADAIDINIGDDSPVNEFGTDNTITIDSTLRVYVDLHVRTDQHEESIFDRLFALRAQTHAAILADWTLGQSFVISIRYQGTEAFDYDLAGDRLASLRTVWDIAYRMDYADPTT
jgi:hypothetical protein